MGPTGFTDSFTSGELCDDAWDRTDIQPVMKGCEQAQNLVIRIQGPLGKRRGFWLNGPMPDQAHLGKMIPFRRSPADALVLLFQNEIAYVWQTNGQPLMNGGSQVSFTTPFTDVQAATGLRFKQVGDVIYFFHATGLQPQILTRNSDTDWTWTTPTLKNGPWLAENTDLSLTLSFSGTDEVDANTSSTAGSILTGQSVGITASADYFTSDMVGLQFRIRPPTGAASMRSWTAGLSQPVGFYVEYNGNVYICTADPQNDNQASTPPVTTTPNLPQSDGDCTFEFRNDGSGIVQITSVSSATAANGTVISTLPVKTAQPTSYFSQAAYCPLNGWPTAWPEIREERLATGAPSANLDWADLTYTAGFSTTTLDYTPGTGTGQVIDTNAIRRRIGVDGGQILWFDTANYLCCGSTDGEFLIAGSVLDEPLSPSGVTIKQLSSFGSADVQPQMAWGGLLFVARAGKTLREISIDNQQSASGNDRSYMATHIANLGLAQLAWVPEPDDCLWTRLSSGGFACFTYHKEQQVIGWTRQLAAAGFTVLDEIVMPGPGNLETLWILASQTTAGVTTTFLMMQSQPTDGLFMDAALAYAGAATNVLSGIPSAFDGQQVDVLAGDGINGGAWYPDLTVSGGEVSLPDGATCTAAQVGFTFPVYFKSLKLDARVFNGTLLTKQRVASALVDIKGTDFTIGLDDGPGEEVLTREWTDVETVITRRKARRVALVRETDSEDQDRDPRIVIQEKTPFDFVIYAIKEDQIALGS